MTGQEIAQQPARAQPEIETEVADQGGSTATAQEGGIQGFLKNEMYKLEHAGSSAGSAADGERAIQSSGPTAAQIGMESIHGQLERSNKLEVGDRIKKFGPKESEPTAQERQEAIDRAHKALERNPLFKLLSPEDRATATTMQAAVMSGDTKALGELVKGLADKPETLEALAKAIGENLDKLGSKSKSEMGPDGSLLVFKDRDSRAVQIGKDGSSKVVAIEQDKDGGLNIRNDVTVVRPTAAELAKKVGDSAVNWTNFTARFSNAIPWDMPRQLPNRDPGNGEIEITSYPNPIPKEKVSGQGQ
jgi:hypothetical protein